MSYTNTTGYSSLGRTSLITDTLGHTDQHAGCDQHPHPDLQRRQPGHQPHLRHIGNLTNDGTATYNYDALNRIEPRGQASGKVALACEHADPTFPEAGVDCRGVFDRGRRISSPNPSGLKLVVDDKWQPHQTRRVFDEAGGEIPTIALPQTGSVRTMLDNAGAIRAAVLPHSEPGSPRRQRHAS